MGTRLAGVDRQDIQDLIVTGKVMQRNAAKPVLNMFNQIYRKVGLSMIFFIFVPFFLMNLFS